MNAADRPTGFDVSDWLAGGGTAEGLRVRIAAAPEWEPAAAPEGAGAAGPPGATLVVTSLADVRPRPVAWLWERWLARGKLHILGGHPGDGKSTLAAAVAAACSVRGALPDGTRAPLARWLFLLAEDALDDTLRPRLDALGADPAAVFAIEAVKAPDGRDVLFSLAEHLPLLEAKIAELGIDVVVIDPVTSFMSRSNRNDEGDVRDVLTPLGKLAERTGVAVLAIMHVGKPNGAGRRPLQLLLGATAFGAIARVVWMVAPCPGDEAGSRRVLGVVKSNLAMRPAALEWSREEDGPICWHGASAHRLDDLLGNAGTAPRADAEGFLQETLKGGSKPATELLGLAQAVGISERTLRRAADDLGVERFKLPGTRNGPWLWKLPDGRVHGVGRSEGKGKMATAEEGKVATPEDGHLATFDSSDETVKVATASASGHLPTMGEHREGGHLATFGGGHLPVPGLTGRVCVECGGPLPAGTGGLYCARHGGSGRAEPDLAATVAGILALSPEERAAYRAELEMAGADDPYAAHDRAAWALALAALAGEHGGWEEPRA